MDLHAEGRLVLLDARDRLGILHFLVGFLVDAGDGIDRLAPHIAGNALRGAEIKNRVAFRAALHALVNGRQEAAAPSGLSGVRLVAAGG